MLGWLTTRQCADILGVSSTFVREEIQDGRLVGQVLDRPVLTGRTRARKVYRIPVDAFRAYCESWCPTALSKVPPAA